MRAVNLIPLEDRRSGVLLLNRSGGGIYLLLLGLAGLVLLCALWTKAGWDADAARADAGRQAAQAAALEATAAVTPQSQAGWAALRDRRLERVTSLLDERFDWSHALRELARVLPTDVDITALDASTSPGDGAGGSGGGAGSGVRAALPAPAIELTGCAQDHDHVMAAVSALRAMDGVQRVTLERSSRPDGGGDADASSDAAPATACRPSSSPRPTFSAVVFLTAPAPPATTTTTGSTAP